MSFWGKLSRSGFNDSRKTTGNAVDIGQERSAPPGGSQNTTSSSEPSLACHRCGSQRVEQPTGTHLRCVVCGTWMKLDGSSPYLDTPLEPMTITYAGFVGKFGIGIIERTLSGEEIASRPATKRERKPQSGFMGAMSRLLGRGR